MSLFSTYAQGQLDIANWLHRTGDTSLTDSIPDFIRLAELRIYRDLRVRAMEASLSTAIASGVIAVPSGYVAMKYAYVDGTPVQALQRKDPEWIAAHYPTRSADGKPKFFAREVDSFIFGPYPDDAYTVKGVYYKRLDALSASNTTNWFTDNAPDVLFWGAMLESAIFAGDDARVALYQSKYDAAGQRLQREDEAEEFSGSILSMTAR
jgi:hypothetical protein